MSIRWMHRLGTRLGIQRPRSARLGRLAATALFLLVLCVCQSAHAGWWDSAAEARQSTLHDVRRAPERWRDVPVLLRVSFTETGRCANPHFTQFTAERWRPITVEGRAGARVTPARESRLFGKLFVRRGSPADLRLPTLRPGRSLLLRAVVRDVVAGEPWIEILAITLDGDPLTPEERTRLREADRFLARANPPAAEKLYRGVLGGRQLADADRAGVLRKLGVSLHDQKRGQEALVAFRGALSLAPEHVDTQTQVAAIEKRLARTPAGHSAESGATEAERRPGIPRNAGRAAPSPPEPEAPLYLPGGRTPLAPPGGGTEPPRAAGPEKKRPKTRASRPQLPPLPAPLGSSSQPTGKQPAAGKADDEDDEQDEPPAPVPARPGLSGPK